MKPATCFGMTLLFLSTVVSVMAYSDHLRGVGGIVIGIFLAYCAIIVVAQLYAALSALRGILEENTEQRQNPKKIPLP